MTINYPNDNKPVAVVYETRDYDWFKFIECNRKTDHVKALIFSMKERLVPNAILCNEKGEIIDGQNRFLALKEMGKPILYYVLEGLGIYDVAFLNSYAKNWNNKDFIKMWADLGIDEYRKVLMFNEQFSELGLPNNLIILSGSITTVNGTGYVLDGSFEKSQRYRNMKPRVMSVRNGKFKIGDYDEAVNFARAILKYKEFEKPGQASVFNHRAFVTTMMNLIRQDAFENDEMVRKARKFPSLFYRCTNTDEYVKMLQDLWNYNRRNKVGFVYLRTRKK